MQSVVLKGREGISRLISCKPHALYEDIADEMDDDLSEQPKLQGFFDRSVFRYSSHTKFYTFLIIYLQRWSIVATSTVEEQNRNSA